jgi:hypothetical protein
MGELRAVNERIPLELVIVSNHEALADAAIRPFGVPMRYVAWSPETVYAELGAADVALLTTGDDDFSITKSANRVLLALSAGVPVVVGTSRQATSDPELETFSDCVMTKVERGLDAYLGPDRQKNVAAAMTAAEKVLARYSPHNLAQIWLDLLVGELAERRAKSVSQSDGRLVLAVENGDSLDDFDAVVAACGRQGRQRIVSGLADRRCRLGPLGRGPGGSELLHDFRRRLDGEPGLGFWRHLRLGSFGQADGHPAARLWPGV